MTRSSSDTPAQSAAQAAIAAPPHGAAEVLQRAARCASEQLERGRDLPLALLMDCEQLLGVPIGLRPTWREQERQPHYERWLDNVVAEMRRWWSGNDARLTLDAVAALIRPCDATPAADHGRLAELRKVAAGATESVLQSWRGPRRRADWADDIARLPLGGTPAQAEGLTARLAGKTGGAWVDESLDHEAARQFLRGGRWRPSPRQQARIARLRRATLPPRLLMTESYEELALHEGAITVSTLALGPYGEFLIVNRMDPRLTSPPPVQPPPLVRLHFSRLLGPRSLSQRLPAPRMATTDDAGAGCSAPASVVQALVAWLADDWRSLLAGLPVELVGHRGSDDRDGMAWSPGPRWQPLREDAPAPPTSMVDRLLRRAGWLDLDPKGFSLAGASDWWCLVTARDDLDHFGLDAVRAPPSATLPLQVAMLVIVDADEQQGQVLHLRSGGSTLAAGSWRSPARDPSYLALRTHCLDAVLQTLERRL